MVELCQMAVYYSCGNFLFLTPCDSGRMNHASCPTGTRGCEGNDTGKILDIAVLGRFLEPEEE